ncbi:hypothetical protein P7C70_g1124, partial [Phenoliferia sp. Uapishka_3]
MDKLAALEHLASDGHKELTFKDEDDRHEPFHHIFSNIDFTPKFIGARRSAKKLLEIIDLIVEHGESSSPEVVRMRVNALSRLAVKYLTTWEAAELIEAATNMEDSDYKLCASGSDAEDSDGNSIMLDVEECVLGEEAAEGLQHKISAATKSTPASSSTRSSKASTTGKKRALSTSEPAPSQKEPKKPSAIVIDDAETCAPLYKPTAGQEDDSTDKEDRGEYKSYFRRPNISTKNICKASLLCTFYTEVAPEEDKKNTHAPGDKHYKCNQPDCRFIGKVTKASKHAQPALEGYANLFLSLSCTQLIFFSSTY